MEVMEFWWTYRCLAAAEASERGREEEETSRQAEGEAVAAAAADDDAVAVVVVDFVAVESSERIQICSVAVVAGVLADEVAGYVGRTVDAVAVESCTESCCC